ADVPLEGRRGHHRHGVPAAPGVAVIGPLRQVLVVDPEPHIPRLVALLLGDGYHVDHAATAEAAFERLHATPYDAVLLEIEDDDTDGDHGLAMLRRLRKQAPDLAVLIFTAQPT